MKQFSTYYLALTFCVLLIFCPVAPIFSQLSWQATNSEKAYPIAAFTSKDSTLFIGTLGGGIYKTTDECETWTSCNNGLSNFFVTSFSRQATSLFAGTYDGAIFHSNDEGKSWFLASDTLNLKTWSLASLGNRLFAGTVSGIYYTDDKGVWVKVKMPENNAAHHIIYSLLIRDNLILAGSSGYVYYSEDGGNNWQQSPIGSSFEVRQLLFQNGHFLAGTSGTGWFLSEDGKEWLKHPQLKEADNVHAAILVENDLVTALSLKGVVQENEPINEGITDFDFKSLTYHRGKLYGGTYQQGVFRYDMPPNLVAESSAKSRTSTIHTPQNTTFSLSPNPVKKGPINLAYSLSENAPVSIQLFDVNGVLMSTVLQANLSPGSYTNTFSTNDLSSGVYYFTFSTGAQKITKQLTITN